MMTEKWRSALIFAVAGGLFALLVFGVVKWLQGSSSAVHKAPKISLIPNAPPPPPPPPKEEKRPEPPKEQKVQKEVPDPPKEAAPAPPSQELKMEGMAGDGPSAFSAGKVTSEDLGRLGKPTAPVTSGAFNPFNNFATLLKGETQRFLARHQDLRQRGYRVDLAFWIGHDGRVSRFELQGSSGDEEIDDLLRQTLAGLGRVSQVPPPGMPQPVRLRLTTGGR